MAARSVSKKSTYWPSGWKVRGSRAWTTSPSPAFQPGRWAPLAARRWKSEGRRVGEMPDRTRAAGLSSSKEGSGALGLVMVVGLWFCLCWGGVGGLGVLRELKVWGVGNGEGEDTLYQKLLKT